MGASKNPIFLNEGISISNKLLILKVSSWPSPKRGRDLLEFLEDPFNQLVLWLAGFLFEL